MGSRTLHHGIRSPAATTIAHTHSLNIQIWLHGKMVGIVQDVITPKIGRTRLCQISRGRSEMISPITFALSVSGILYLIVLFIAHKSKLLSFKDQSEAIDRRIWIYMVPFFLIGFGLVSLFFDEITFMVI